MLKDYIKPYYFDGNYNCAETILRAGNDYYQLGLHDRDMKLVAAYGAGIQTGSTCGALLSAAAILSMKYVEQRAHESADIKPVTTMMMERFSQKLGDVMCSEVKARHFQPGVRCLHTVETACDVLEEVMAAYDALKEGAAE